VTNVARVTASLTIPARFNGPAQSGNGGVTAGRLALALSMTSPVRVTLMRPPPLDVAMNLAREGETLTARLDGVDIAKAELVAEVGEPVERVEFADAVGAASHYAGLSGHPFPTCFVCGPDRPLRDGLEVFAGSIDNDPYRTAAPFVPRPEHTADAHHSEMGQHIGADLVWAALDCPGGWAINLPERPAVLGRMTAQVLDVPAVGEHCVIVGVMDGRDGRKAFTRTTAYGADGRELGRAAATWIEIARA
jgi:hypothetical protein